MDESAPPLSTEVWTREDLRNGGMCPTKSCARRLVGNNDYEDISIFVYRTVALTSVFIGFPFSNFQPCLGTWLVQGKQWSLTKYVFDKRK